MCKRRGRELLFRFQGVGFVENLHEKHGGLSQPLENGALGLDGLASLSLVRVGVE